MIVQAESCAKFASCRHLVACWVFVRSWASIERVNQSGRILTPNRCEYSCGFAGRKSFAGEVVLIGEGATFTHKKTEL